MTQLFGVLGWPVSHSRSPAMHNAALRALGIDGLYVPLAVPPERLHAMVASLRARRIAGVNVTLPHKTAIMPLLDRVTDAARCIAAVNTVFREGEKLVGDNTDAEGLTRSLVAAGVALSGAEVVLLGAGGAARAAAYGLALAGAARIVIAARRREQAEDLVRELGPACGSTALAALALADAAALAESCARATLLAQSTSATLVASGSDDTQARAFAAALPISALPSTAAVVDLVYKPLETSVLACAQARGLRTVDGLGMLLHQGALAFERWTGKPAPLATMRDALAL